jgi:acetylornithine deacetylase/succinyl-diaminopimelate desuccinylase-like protein
MYMGTGGSIPFMGMLGQRFPGTQFLVTGVLGPNSNAHGPNEFLHIDTARKLTACVAHVLADHAGRQQDKRAA